MRITLVIYSLSAGGAERVMATMANYWAEKGWQITLLTLDDGRSAFYELHSRINHRPLDVAGVSRNPLNGLINNLKRIRALRSAIRASSPNVVISLLSQTNVVTVLAASGLNVPVLVQEQIDPYQESIGMAWSLLRRWTYSRASRVVLLTERSFGYFPPAVRRRACVIPNPVLISSSAERPHARDREQKKVLAIGRLVSQKGFDMLIRAFAQIASRHAGWVLEIWGEGPLRSALQSLIAELGLSGRANMPGITRDAFGTMRGADLFVLSSRYEGFPLALCEAMACGLPVIGFDCPTGPREIIRNDVDGVLTPAGDIDALAQAMDRLMSEPEERLRLAQRAPEVLDRFGIHRVMGMWESVIQEAL